MYRLDVSGPSGSISLGHLNHVGGDARDLGLAALERGPNRGRGDDRDLRGQRPDVGGAAAVDAEVWSVRMR